MAAEVNYSVCGGGRPRAGLQVISGPRLVFPRRCRPHRVFINGGNVCSVCPARSGVMLVAGEAPPLLGRAVLIVIREREC